MFPAYFHVIWDLENSKWDVDVAVVIWICHFWLENWFVYFWKPGEVLQKFTENWRFKAGFDKNSAIFKRFFEKVFVNLENDLLLIRFMIWNSIFFDEIRLFTFLKTLIWSTRLPLNCIFNQFWQETNILMDSKTFFLVENLDNLSRHDLFTNISKNWTQKEPEITCKKISRSLEVPENAEKYGIQIVPSFEMIDWPINSSSAICQLLPIFNAKFCLQVCYSGASRISVPGAIWHLD